MIRHLSMIVLACGLSACANIMSNPTLIESDKLQLQPETIQHHFEADRVSKSTLNEIALDIKRRAESPVTVDVHYLLRKPLAGTQRVANAQGARVKSYLQQNGVRNQIQIMMTPSQTDALNHIYVRYEALSAAPPSHCLPIEFGDANNYSHESDSGYRYGCANKDYISQQIARPGDLLGRDTTPGTDSQRLGKSQDTYRSGERATNPADEGLTASTVYEQ